jgi:uncharacterized membrane protein
MAGHALRNASRQVGHISRQTAQARQPSAGELGLDTLQAAQLPSDCLLVTHGGQVGGRGAIAGQQAAQVGAWRVHT